MAKAHSHCTSGDLFRRLRCFIYTAYTDGWLCGGGGSFGAVTARCLNIIHTMGGLRANCSPT